MRLTPRCIIALCLTSILSGVPGVMAQDRSPEPSGLDGQTREIPMQAGLAEAISEAKPLNLESLMDGPQSVMDNTYRWFLNPDGQTWDLVMFYRKDYIGPYELFVLDTGTGEFKPQEPFIGINHAANPDNGENSVHVDGIWYFRTFTHSTLAQGQAKGDVVMAYDPAKNLYYQAGRPWGPDHQNYLEGRVWTLGSDNWVYGFSNLAGSKQLAAWRFNPTTMECESHPFGPEQKRIVWMYNKVWKDGDWLYTRIGNSPWKLWAFNFKTLEHRLLAQTDDQVIGSPRTIGLQPLAETTSPRERIAGYRVTIRPHLDQDIIATYWLKDGVLTKTENNTPPWMDKPVRNLHRRKASPQLPPKPQVMRTEPDARTGQVTLTWRPAGSPPDEPAREIKFNVTRYNKPLRHMAALSEGKIFAVSDGYGQAVLYDTRTNQRTALGHSSLSIYAVAAQGTKAYLSGYPSAQLWEFDATEPWTHFKAHDLSDATNSREAGLQEPDANPRSLLRYNHTGDNFKIHQTFPGVVIGSDGKIYSSGVIIRIGNGGGLIWYDPATGRHDGMLDEFSAYRPFWMIGVDDGDMTNRYLIINAKATLDDDDPSYTPDRGRTFVYDTHLGKMAYVLDAPWQRATPGPVTATGQGMAVGLYSRSDKPEISTLYALHVPTGKIQWIRDVPFNIVTSYSTARRRAGTLLTTSPDGKVWSIWNNTLVTINPQDGQVEVMGNIPEGTTGQILFVDGRPYFAGDTSLRTLPAQTNHQAASVD